MARLAKALVSPCTIPARFRNPVVALLAATPLIAAAPRIVAVGDVHGSYDGLVGILRPAGLLDDDDHWIGGATTLVQVGDLLDRGADVRAVMDLLMRLQGEAAAAGGKGQDDASAKSSTS